jgi:hypothetical protein
VTSDFVRVRVSCIGCHRVFATTRCFSWHRCYGVPFYLLTPAALNGTIDSMNVHRPRLTDSDMSLVVSALRARLAMTTGDRRRQCAHLIERLEDSGPGSPRQRFGWETPEDFRDRVRADDAWRGIKNADTTHQRDPS